VKGYAVGIDLGGTNLKGGIVSEDGRIVAKRVIPSMVEEGPHRVLDRLLEMAGVFLSEARGKNIPLAGIGAITPGIVDPEYGGIPGGSANLPGWEKIPFMKVLHERFGLPVFAHNDVTAHTLGELTYGAGAGKQNLVMASFGTGIGGGIIIGGRVYDGKIGYAGEIGHIVIRAEGRPCACGSRGCWEEYASVRGIENTSREITEEFRGESGLFTRRDPDSPHPSPQEIFELADRGDALALEIAETVGRDTAVGIGSLLNVFNPEVFVIGGGIARAGKFYLDIILRHLPDWCLPESLREAEVVLAGLGWEAGIVGACALVFENLNRYEP
jgi:glucokinase